MGEPLITHDAASSIAFVAGRAGRAVVRSGMDEYFLVTVEATKPTPCDATYWSQLRSLHPDGSVVEAGAHPFSDVAADLAGKWARARCVALLLVALDRDHSDSLRERAAGMVETFLSDPACEVDIRAMLMGRTPPSEADFVGGVMAAERVKAGHLAALLKEAPGTAEILGIVRRLWIEVAQAIVEPADREEAMIVLDRLGVFARIADAFREGMPAAKRSDLGGWFVRTVAPALRIPQSLPLLTRWLTDVTSKGVAAEARPKRLKGVPASSARSAEEGDVQPGVDERESGRERGIADRAGRLRSPGIFLAVQRELDEFDQQVRAVRRNPAAVTPRVTTVLRRLQELQGTDHENLSKSASSVATILRREGLNKDALTVLEWVRARSAADVVVYSQLVATYASVGDVSRAREVFDEAKACGRADEVTYNALVDAYGKAGDLPRAREVFDEAKACGRADEFTYSALVDAYGKAGDLPRAREVFDEAKACGRADEFTYSALVDAYGKAGDLPRAREVFDKAKADGRANEVTHNALVDAYGKAGDLPRAREVFNEVKACGRANEVTYSALVDAYGKAGDLPRAREVFDEAKACGCANEVTYSALVDAYGKAGDLPRAREVFNEAKACGSTDEVTYNALADAYGKAGDLPRAREVFDEAKACGRDNEFTYSALVDAYGKAGDLPRAREVFDEAKACGRDNEVTYNALVDAYGKAGDLPRAREVFDETKACGRDNEVTYNALVDAYGKAGDLPRAREVFDEAKACGRANEVTEIVFLRCAARLGDTAQLASLVDQIISRGPVETRQGRALSATIAAVAARHGRADWLARLPDRARTPRVLFAIALVATELDDAFRLVARSTEGRAASMVLRFRKIARAPSQATLQELASDCRRILDGDAKLDSFTRVRVAETEARCLRRLNQASEAANRWRACDALIIGDAETRAALLAESGRDICVAALEKRNAGESMEGARRLVGGWSLARASDLNDPETIWSLAEGLAGFADVKDALDKSPSNLVATVRPVLAQGALDGKWAMAAVDTSDLPELFMAPARRGMTFLRELKAELR